MVKNDIYTKNCFNFLNKDRLSFKSSRWWHVNVAMAPGEMELIGNGMSRRGINDAVNFS